MLATVMSAVHGWDYFWAAIILIVALVLERVVPEIKWVAYTTLFLVSLTFFSLLVHF